MPAAAPANESTETRNKSFFHSTDSQEPAQVLLSTAIMFACVQVGTDNPCRCKVLGPTVGFVVGALSAVICWPLGALSYCCCRDFADTCFGTPVGMFNSIANAAPI